MYSLAINLDFCMILRICELKVLRWDDIKGDYIYIHTFMNDKDEIIPYCKGHTEAGMRYLPLTKACKQILREVSLLTQTVNICLSRIPDHWQREPLIDELKNAVRSSALNTVLPIKSGFLPLLSCIRIVQLIQNYRKCSVIRLLP